MKGKANFTSGTSALTSTLHDMIAGISRQPPVLDFGIINSDLSLTCNTFSQPIPKSDYSVCRQLLYDPSVPLTETYTDGSHGHPDASPPGTHSHKVKLPKKMRWLKSGDKVLVAFIANEAVIIDVVYSGHWLGNSEPNWT